LFGKSLWTVIRANRLEGLGREEVEQLGLHKRMKVLQGDLNLTSAWTYICRREVRG
jgi:hypothetical protein